MSANMRMTKFKARVISTISTNIGQVFFAASVGAVALPLDSGRILVVLSYLLLSMLFWFVAIIFGEKGKV